MSIKDDPGASGEATYVLAVAEQVWSVLHALGLVAGPVVLLVSLSWVRAPLTGPMRWLLPGALVLLLVLAAVFAFNLLWSMRGASIRVGREGLSLGTGRNGARTIPWSALRGVRRPVLSAGTALTDAQGTVLATIDDRLALVGSCLERITDAAAIGQSALPVSHRAHGALTMPVLTLALAILLGALLISGGLTWPGLLATAFFVAISRWHAMREVRRLLIDEDGIELDYVLGRETFRWNEVRSCGFPSLPRLQQNSVDAVLTTTRGARRLVPAGAPALVIVATIRGRLRQRVRT